MPRNADSFPSKSRLLVVVALCILAVLLGQFLLRRAKPEIDSLGASEASPQAEGAETPTHAHATPDSVEANPEPVDALEVPDPPCIRGRLLGAVDALQEAARITVAPISDTAGCGDGIDADAVAEIESDARGEFAIGGIDLGLYSVLAEFPDGSGARGHANLTAEQPCADLILNIAPLLSARGSVVDETGNPIPGATIAVVARDGFPEDAPMNPRAHSDATGAFHLFPLTKGEWKLQVCASGYGTVTTPWYEPPVTDIRVVLPAPQWLEGTVLMVDTGEPVSGVLVEARSISYGELKGTTTTDEHGAFSFEGVSGESVNLSLDDPVLSLVEPSGKVRVRAGSDPVALYATSGAQISGTVYGQTGDPMEGVRIVGPSKSSEPTGPDGRYVVAGLAPGRARFTPMLDRQRLKHTPLVEIQLSAGATLEEVDFHTTPGATLRGKVLSPDGSPVPGAKVVAQSITDDIVAQQRHECVTDREGAYLLAGLDPDLPYCVVATTVSAASEAAGPVEFGEVLGRELDLVLSLETRGLLAGKLVDERNKPAIGIVFLSVTHAGRRMPGLSIATDPDGQFVAGIPDDVQLDFQVGVRSYPGQPTRELEVPAPARFYFRAASFRAPLILKVKPGPEGKSISGHVTDTSEDPVSSALVSAQAEDGGAASGVFMTGMDGRFILGGLAEGKYSVLASKHGYGRASAENIAAGSEGVEIVLSLPPALAGRVVDAESHIPLQSFELKLQSPPPAGLPEGTTFRPSEDGWNSFATPDGSFSIEVNFSGYTTLLCGADGYEVTSVPINLDDDAHDNLLIELTPLAGDTAE